MRWLVYFVLAMSWMACAETALALDPLLVEFGWSQPNPVTLPANYIAAINGAYDWANVPNTITAYPTTQFADSDAINFWNQTCAAGTSCGIGFANGRQQPSPFSAAYLLDNILGGPNQVWADGWDGNAQPFSNHTGTWHAATYVPQKGNGNQALYGYLITAVEREVTATTQTLRLYGVNAPVPEPSTIFLVTISCLAHTTARRRRCIPSFGRSLC